MLAEFAVVEADDEPQPGVQPAGHEGGPYVGLVVLVDEGQRGRPGDPGGGQGLFVGGRRLQNAQFGYGRFPRAGPVPGGRTDPRGREPPQQRTPGPDPGAGPVLPGDRSGAHLASGRHDQRHPLLVHLAEFGGQPVGEPVVPAHDHQVGGFGRLGMRGR